ncbi:MULTISPECIES: DUF317 domain-containing protein [Streptomyces]|uniref:DUF317 domain-containing protein n=1 Tax=Streptomyces ramulosus TaxID=47762 RepID=A0ABW1FUK6_9ACTN
MRRTPQSVLRHPVAPRYLAGSGDPRYVTAPLYAVGWTVSTQHLPGIRLASPGGSRTLQLAPRPDGESAPHPHGESWTITGRPDRGWAWSISADGQTPVEIIGAATDALTSGHAPTGNDEFAVLRSAGWSVSRGRLTTATSPDGTCVVGTTAGAGLSILADCPDTGRTLWRAHLSGATPTPVVTALIGSLASPYGVLRPRHALPVSPSHLRVGEAVRIPAHRLVDLRVAAARRALRRGQSGPFPLPPSPAGDSRSPRRRP